MTDLNALADELEAWHGCADGDVNAGNGHFRVHCISDSEQTRLNLRVSLRDAAKALRAAASSQAGVETATPASSGNTQPRRAAWINKDVLAEIMKDKHSTGTVASPLIRKPFDIDKVMLYTAPPPAPSGNEALPKRPFAFAVRRAPENGTDKWRLFLDEGEARAEAEQIDGDYEGLYRVGDRRSILSEAACTSYAEGEAPWSEDKQFDERAKACRYRVKRWGECSGEGDFEGQCDDCNYDAQEALKKKYAALGHTTQNDASIEAQVNSAVRAWLECPVEKRPSAQALGIRVAEIASDKTVRADAALSTPAPAQQAVDVEVVARAVERAWLVEPTPFNRADVAVRTVLALINGGRDAG